MDDELTSRRLGPIAPAFYHASAIGDLGLVVALLDSGVHPDERDTSGYAPLHYAVNSGYAAVVEALIRGGATVDVVDGRGYTPLWHATAAGISASAMISLLLDLGADPDHLCGVGFTARKHGIWTETSELFRGRWVDPGDIADRGDELVRRLRAGIVVGDAVLVAAMLLLGVDPDVVDEDGGWCLLDFALEAGRPVVLQVLIDAGADVNRRGRGGITPLAKAVGDELDSWQQGGVALDLRLIQPLLDAGADPYVLDDGGVSAYRIACERYYVDARAAMELASPAR